MSQIELSQEIRQASMDLLQQLVTAMTGRVYSPRIKLLSIDQVAEATGLGKSTIYELVKAGKFPRPQENLGRNLWRESAIIAWCDRNDPNMGEGR